MRFRLRTLLISVLLIALALSWPASRMNEARRQRNAVVALNRIGAQASLRSLHRLRTLYLWGTEIGDTGIENIADLKELRRLGLQSTLITDAGVERLQGLKNLDTLVLAGTRVTDGCVPHLVGLKKLTYLGLSDTQISERGIARLSSELPRARIIHHRYSRM